jgi:acetamidase/formamidase
MNMKIAWFAILAAAGQIGIAASVSGEWTAQVQPMGDPIYARVTLRESGTSVTGTWNGNPLSGTVSGDSLEFSVGSMGKFHGRVEGAEWKGEGTMSLRANPRAAEQQTVSWKMMRTPQPLSTGPKTWDFEPKTFARNYSAAIPPVLHVFPGDTIRTWTVDAGGLDKNLERRSPGGNPETGPFYIEGALPGDTLVVKLNKLRLNRDTARSGNRMNGRSITPAYMAATDYQPDFNSEWKLDRTKGIATLASPTPRMKGYQVPILPMLGCLGTAPAQNQSFRSEDLGPFGGNMDYNQMGEGVTLYLPVFQLGALFFLGDGHAAMGDGELTGGALETSLDVEFTVDLIRNSVIPAPRLENADYVMSVGVAGSLQEALQAATSQLASWLKSTYKLNDSEIAVLLGTVLKYDITELVDPQYDVVAKVPKSALKGLQ